MATLRSCVRLSMAFCITCLFGANSWAQSYPTKVIRYVVPGSTGSGGDVLGRVVAAGLAQTLGQQVIVDNRPGASGKIGTEMAAKAPPDGYLLLQLQIAHALYASSAKNPSYDLQRDFATVTQLVAAPNVVVVHPSLPVKSIGELIKMAKARPGALNVATAGPGSSTFIATESFRVLTGIDILQVHYNGGGPTLIGVVTGECQVYFAPFATALPFVQQGRLRALAVTTSQRMPAAPELPTVAEAGVAGYEFSQWYGLAVPARTPRENIMTIRNAVATVFGRPEVKRTISDLGAIPVGNQPEEFAAYIKSQIATLTKVFPNRTID